VKWNYKDANLLASAHSDEVLIWDRRVRQEISGNNLM